MRARLLTILSAAVCLMMLAAPGEAHAKRKSKIDTVGIEALDDVFRAAREIDNTVISGQRQRRLAREEVNASLGLRKKNPFTDSIQTLRRRAPSTLRLQLTDGMPQLVAQQALSADMTSSISAVNSAVSRYATIAKKVASLPASTQRLVSSLQALDLDSLGLSSTSSALTHLTRISTYKTNLQAITKLPKKTQTLLRNLQADIQAVKSAFRR